ncbi:MAG: hypothetical protein ACYS8L_08060 [Planctomycetota bacterium]|jgi:hypothetical protein
MDELSSAPGGCSVLLAFGAAGLWLLVVTAEGCGGLWVLVCFGPLVVLGLGGGIVLGLIGLLSPEGRRCALFGLGLNALCIAWILLKYVLPYLG